MDEQEQPTQPERSVGPAQPAQPEQPTRPAPQLDQRARRRAQWTVFAIVAALVAGAVAHRLTVVGKIDQTAALFIGVPAVIALAVGAMRPAKSATGLTFRVITLGLVLAGILLGEGLICLIMAAPLFYLVGFAISATVDYVRARQAEQSGEAREAGLDQGRMYSLVLPLLPAIALALEGNAYTFPRQEQVVAERIVVAAPAQVEAALSETPHFDGDLPLFLQIGFPRPVASQGHGLAVGDRRVVSFLGRKKGLRPRDLTLEVVAREQAGDVQRVRFRAVSDQSKIAQWLRWREAEVEWSPAAGGATTGTAAPTTLVRWTLRYERQLDPAWYFAPFERYATSLAADYLVQSAATPR